MKHFVALLLMLISVLGLSQNSDVYVEFYNQDRDYTFITDGYQIDLYDNVEQVDTITGEKTYSAGFVIKMSLICNTETERLLAIYKIVEGDKGIIRMRTWGTKLYGYCYVSDITENIKGHIVVYLVGRKNVPQRKKLLFKDSPRLRMCRYPWLGE